MSNKEKDSYRNILIEEILKQVDRLMERKKVIDANKVTKIICSNHRDEILEGADFSVYNIYSNVRREVRNVISQKLGIDDEQANGQLTIEGFRRVQQYYAITRNGIPLVVPVEQLTDEEVEEKAAWYRKCGLAHFEHADELIAYHESIKV